MAKYETKSGKTYDSRKGVVVGQRSITPVDFFIHDFYEYHKYKYKIPAWDMVSLTKDEVIELIKDTVELNRPLTDSEILKIAGDKINAENKIAFYHHMLDLNAAEGTLDFDSTGKKILKDEDGKPVLDIKGNPTYADESSSGNDAPVDTDFDWYKEAIDNSLFTDATSAQAQQYRNAMNESINAYESSTNATLAQTELDAYRMLGQQQLELENNIAAQRMQAIKSGVTSAQLASQQLANMFAAQSGAAQVAQSVMSNRAQQANQFGQQRASIESDLYNIINNNATNKSNAYAQLAAVQGSYASMINQPYAQYGAAYNLYDEIGKDKYEGIMGINSNK